MYRIRYSVSFFFLEASLMILTCLPLACYIAVVLGFPFFVIGIPFSSIPCIRSLSLFFMPSWFIPSFWWSIYVINFLRKDALQAKLFDTYCVWQCFYFLLPDWQFENGLEIIVFSSELWRKTSPLLSSFNLCYHRSDANLILDSLLGTWFSSLEIFRICHFMLLKFHGHGLWSG